MPHSAPPWTGWLLVSEGFNTLAAILGSVLVAMGRVWRAASIACLLVFVSVPLIAAMVASLGALGAALAGVIAGPLEVALMAWVIRKEYGPLLQERTAVNALAATGLMALCTLFVPVDLPIRVAIIGLGVLLYGATLIVLKEITTRDIAPLLGRR